LDAKTLNLAGYKDEDGKTRQLCATHARAAGTHAVQVPCRDCPEDAKLSANYKDEWQAGPAVRHACAGGEHVGAD
jgi:hypothetical protein